MKRLQCEMCGSTDILKQDGVFVCQSCGVKYSVEEAKKIMTDVVAEITGTVKVDSSDEISNWYILAERAKDEETKLEYFHKILEKDAESWKAWLHIALLENKLDEDLPGILKCIDKKSKTDNSLFQEGIHYIINHIENDIVYQSGKQYFDNIIKERRIKAISLYDFMFWNCIRTINILKLIADCVDHRFQDVQSDISIEIYKLLEYFIRNIFESIMYFNYLLYLKEHNNIDEYGFYQLMGTINTKLQNNVEDYIPIKPLSPEEQKALIKKEFEYLNNEFYYEPIEVGFSESSEMEEAVSEEIDRRNEDYLMRYEPLIEITKELHFDLDDSDIAKKEPISREMVQLVDFEEDTEAEWCTVIAKVLKCNGNTEMGGPINPTVSSHRKDSSISIFDLIRIAFGELKNVGTFWWIFSFPIILLGDVVVMALGGDLGKDLDGTVTILLLLLAIGAGFIGRFLLMREYFTKHSSITIISLVIALCIGIIAPIIFSGQLSFPFWSYLVLFIFAVCL